MLIVGNHHLFPDAKVLEDILQYHVIGHFSCYVAQMEDAFADVLREEVAGEVGGEAFADAADGILGAGEGLVMAHVGDDDIVLGDGGQVGGVD